MQEYERLEHSLAELLDPQGDHRNVVVCSSGTAALHLAHEVLLNNNRWQIPSPSEVPAWAVPWLPDQVLMSNFNMIACPRSVALSGMVPIFADCDKVLQLDMEVVEKLYTRNTRMRSILVTHIYGRMADVDRLHKIQNSCPRAKVPVIEDLAEVNHFQKHPESFAGCYSFYSNKVIAGEEGGAVVFKNQYLASIARSLRCLGFTPSHNFMHTPRGHNYRMANCLATPILKSISNLQDSLRHRRNWIDMYDNIIPNYLKIPNFIEGQVSPWVYPIVLPEPSKTCEGLQETVRDQVDALSGISMRIGFRPMSIQPEFFTESIYGGEDGRLVSYRDCSTIIRSRELGKRVMYFQVLGQEVEKYYCDRLRVAISVIEAVSREF